MNRRNFTKYLAATVAGVMVSTKMVSAHEHPKKEDGKPGDDCCKDGAMKDGKKDCCKDGAMKDGKEDCCKDGAMKDGKGDCCKDGAMKDGKEDCCKDGAMKGNADKKKGEDDCCKMEDNAKK